MERSREVLRSKATVLAIVELSSVRVNSSPATRVSLLTSSTGPRIERPVVAVRLYVKEGFVDNVKALLDTGASTSCDTISREAMELAKLTAETIEPTVRVGIGGLATYNEGVWIHVSLGGLVKQVYFLVSDERVAEGILLSVQSLYLFGINVDCSHQPVQVTARGTELDQPVELELLPPGTQASMAFVSKQSFPGRYDMNYTNRLIADKGAISGTLPSIAFGLFCPTLFKWRSVAGLLSEKKRVAQLIVTEPETTLNIESSVWERLHRFTRSQLLADLSGWYATLTGELEMRADGDRDTEST